MLVAPLMLERARSLEDTRAKQIARGLRGIRQPHPAQRRYPARGDLLGRDDAEIGRLYPRLRRHRAQLRNPARQPADQPALDPQHHDRRQGRAGAVLDHEHAWSASISATATISGRRRRPAISSSATICSARPTTGRSMMAAYPVSAINPEEDAVVVAGINLDWMSKIMSQSRRTAGHFVAAGRQHRRRAGGARRPGQHDRPAARQRAAAVGHRRQGARVPTRRRARFPSPRPTAPSAL